MEEKKIKKVSPLQKALNVWALILILWSIYRTKFFYSEWIDEFIAKPLVFLLPVYIYIVRFEKKSFFDSLWLRYKNLKKDLIFSLLVGVAFIIVASISVYIKNVYFFTFSLSQIFTKFKDFLPFFPITLATAFSEEVVSRGFITKKLYDESKNVVSAAFIGSVFSFVLHIPILFTNLNLVGEVLLLFMVTELILSLANSFIFLGRKSLVAPILIHALHNFILLFAT